MADLLRRGIGGAGDLQATTGVPHQHVAGPQHFEHCVEAAGHGGLFVHARTVAGYVDGHGLVAEGLELGNGAAPAPGAVEAAMHQNESHALYPLLHAALSGPS